MIPRTAKKALAAIVAVGALLATTACDNPIDPDAAKVDGFRISREALFEQVDERAALPEFGLETGREDVFAADGVARVLSSMIADRIYQTTAERVGLQVTDADLEAARADLVGQFGEDTIGSLPTDVVDRWVRSSALRAVVNEYTGAQQWWTDDDIARYHEATKTRACVRHILVETEDEANDIVDQLEAGADFDELARERSLDSGSAQGGGALGCNPRGWFVPVFEAALEGAADGELVGPVASGFDGQTNWHVIRVDEAYRVRSLDETRDAIEALFSLPGGWVEYVLRTTDVQVDPRYGTWDATSGAVLPPAGAQPRS